MIRKRLFLIFPNTANRAKITTAVPILGGIARDHEWEVTYFDTSFYIKRDDSYGARESTGGFQPPPKELMPEFLPKERLVPDLQAEIDECDPDVIAITAMTCDYEYLMTFFPRIRKSDKPLVVIGGLHATFKAGEVLDTGLFDMTCFGQGERTFDEILSRIEEGGRIDNIEGTSYRDRATGKVVHNPVRPLLSEDELWKFEPEYSYFNDKYFQSPFDGKVVNMFHLDLGRGCPYSCTYCGNTALKSAYADRRNFIVTRPLDSTFRLLKKMVNEYKVDVFRITHECFLSNKPLSWLEEFAERWARDIRKAMLFETRAETVREDRLEVLKKSGAPLIQIHLGVESGSKKIRQKVCNRMMKEETIVNAFELIKKHGFRTCAYYMLGFPYETREEIFETIELCKRLDAFVDSVSIFQPLPGQPLTDLCIKEGFITGNEKIPEFTGGSILKMPQITSEEISNLWRVFMLYAKLPHEYWSDIEKCEKDYDANRDLYEELVSLRWKLAEQKKKAVALGLM